MARAAITNAFAIMRQIEAERMTLSDADKATAAAQLPLVAHEATTLPLPELVTESQAAVARNDRVTMYQFARTVTDRLSPPEGKTDRPRMPRRALPWVAWSAM